MGPYAQQPAGPYAQQQGPPASGPYASPQGIPAPASYAPPQGPPPPGPYAYAQQPQRQPYAGGAPGCQFCGAQPAVQATVRGHQGIIYVMRFLSRRGTFCRSCGLATYREMSAKTLIPALVALAIPTLLVIGLFAEGAGPGSSSAPTLAVGDCVRNNGDWHDQDLEIVGCGSADAQYKVTRVLNGEGDHCADGELIGLVENSPTKITSSCLAAVP